ncbi:MAG: hypothetical protein ACU85E_08970 [Gammaproteobacteria bacterium]
MNSLAGVRIAFWSGLSRLFRQGADFFEKKRKQASPPFESAQQIKDAEEDSAAATRLSGAPPHWLAMVRKRAPGFLSRLETFSRQGFPDMGEKRTSTGIAGGDKGKSAPLLFKSPTFESEPRAMIHSEQADSRTSEATEKYEVSVKVDAELIRTRMLGNAAKKSSSAPAAETAQHAVRIESSRLEIDDAGTGRRGQPSSPFQFRTVSRSLDRQTATELPVVEKVVTGPVSFEIVGDKKASIQPAPVVAKSAMAENENTDKAETEINANRVARPGFHREFRTDVVRVDVSKADAGQAGRLDRGHSADFNNGPQIKVRSSRQRQPATGSDSVSSDNYWPNLSGLEKTSLENDQWPELPEDVWTELAHKKELSTHLFTDQNVANPTENLWNG